MEFRRKLYTRGSSFETTIPKPLLFNLNLKDKHEVIFKYDSETGRWYVDFENNSSINNSSINNSPINDDAINDDAIDNGTINNSSINDGAIDGDLIIDDDIDKEQINNNLRGDE